MTPMGKDTDAHIRQPPGDQKEQMLSGKQHKKEVALDSQSYSEDECSVREDIHLCLLTLSWVTFQLCLVWFGFL